MSHRAKTLPILTSQIGYSDEGDALLGSFGQGGLAFEPRHTLFTNLFLNQRLAKKWHLLARAHIGRSTASKTSDSIMNHIDPLISTSFDLAIKKENLFADNDQALLHIHQPLRIEKGAMTLNYATWRSSDRIIYGQQTIPLVPSGRSIELALGYQLPVPIPITFRSAYIHNPEHTKGKKLGRLGFI